MEFPRYYHVFNRGLDKRVIYPSDSYRERFITTTILSRLSKAPKATVFFKQEKLGAAPPQEDMEKTWGPSFVDILAYVLMPNHFHFLLKELIDAGVAKFMHRLGTAYTKYFNIRQEREGRLFTSTYKQVRVETDEQLIHTNRYIHINPWVSSYTKIDLKDLRKYPWSSLPNYLRSKRDLSCQPEEVLRFFASPRDYWKFISEGIENSLERFPPDLFIDVDEIQA